jgi:hypothetical protein
MKTDPAYLLTAEKRGRIVDVLPIFFYKHRYGNILSSVPFPGPLGGIATTEKNRLPVYKTLLRAMCQLATRKNCISATVITSPVTQDYDIYKKALDFDYELENFTQIVPLTPPLSLSHGIRNRLNKKHDLTISESHDPAIIKAWWKIHRERMDEFDSTPIPLAFFLSIAKYLVPASARFFFVWHKNRVVAGCLYIFHRDIMDVYMLSSDATYNSLSPATYLTHHTILWAKKHGITRYNFQSSKKRGDGVYTFKTQWGAKEARYYFLTKTFTNMPTFLKRPLGTIRKAYTWHYVLPFSAWKTNKEDKFSKK